MSKLFHISKLGLFFVILAFSFVLGSCEKDNRDVVPYVYLNLSLGISAELAHLGVMETATITPDENGRVLIRYSNPDYPVYELGSGQFLNGNGLIIYCRNINEYEVYDITCTYKAQDDYCPLERDPEWDGIFNCSCCDSRFYYVSDGFYVLQGPAAMPLKRYPAFIQANSLIIRN